MIKTAFELRTIGNLLKERRKERKLTLEQVSEIIKIRKKYIEALENSDYVAFPSEVYIKGFLKNYAKFLGISESRALAMYRREREYKQKESTIKASSILRDKNLNLNLTPGRILTGAIVIAVIITLIYIGSYIGNILQKPRLAIVNPVEISVGEEKTYQTDVETVNVKGIIELGATLTINGQELDTEHFEEFSTQLRVEPGLNKFLFKAESQFGRASELTLSIIRQESGAEIPPEQGTDTTPIQAPLTTEEITPTPGQVGAMDIKVMIDGREAYVEIIIDGQNVAGRVFADGVELDYEAQDRISIYTPRPDAIKLIINGEEKSITSIKKYTFELQNGEVVEI